jgi:hypothetical protein
MGNCSIALHGSKRHWQLDRSGNYKAGSRNNRHLAKLKPCSVQVCHLYVAPCLVRKGCINRPQPAPWQPQNLENPRSGGLVTFPCQLSRSKVKVLRRIYNSDGSDMDAELQINGGDRSDGSEVDGHECRRANLKRAR